MGDGAGGYRTEYVWYSQFLERDEARIESLRLVDTIDLDEDGTDEVVVSRDYESNEYEIPEAAGGPSGNGYTTGGGGGPAKPVISRTQG